ncbi:MAG: NfeD family protein [Spirochaetes bacterium]|nr:NfeD family protein [Spirochaetota bacterium]
MEIINLEVIWLILGVVLLISEIFIPGLVISFFSAGALITALLTWLGITKSLQMQLLVFSVSSVVMLTVFHLFIKKYLIKENKNKKNTFNINLELGKIVPVVELIEPDGVSGKVRYQGTIWSARSNEKTAPGETVRIIGCDNLTLIVEKIKKEEK